MAAFDYRHSTPITAGQRSYMRTADPSETLLNGQTQYSIVTAGHQDLGDRLTFEFDGNFSDRKNEVCINFTATDGCLASGSNANVRTQSWRSEEHTSALQALMRISHAVFCLNKNTKN